MWTISIGETGRIMMLFRWQVEIWRWFWQLCSLSDWAWSGSLIIRVSSIGSLTNPEKWKPEGKMRTFYEGHFFQYGKSEISFFRSEKVALPLLSWSVWLLSTGNRCHQATPVAIGVVVLIPCFGGRSSKVMSGLSGSSTIWTIWHDLMICNMKICIRNT